MHRKVVKLSFMLSFNPAVDEEGRSVWQVTCDQLPGVSANGQSPEHAEKVFLDELAKGRLMKSRAVYNAEKKVAEPVVEEEVEVVEEVKPKRKRRTKAEMEAAKAEEAEVKDAG